MTINGMDLSLNVDFETTPSSTNKAELRIVWFDSQTLSHIPFSTVKLGFFQPTTVEIVDGILIGHDGFRHKTTGTEYHDVTSSDFDVISACLYELELRIFNNLSNESSFVFGLNEIYPNFQEFKNISLDGINSRLDDWYNRWLSDNSIEEETNSYVVNDEFTWNYSSVAPGIGGWRGLYNHFFGTYRPHTHPWEMLEYRVKPSWWDDHYSWKPESLVIDDIEYNTSTGTVTITTEINHGLSTGDSVSFDGIIYSSSQPPPQQSDDLNFGDYVITVTTDNKFTLDGVDSEDLNDYDSGGNVIISFIKANALKTALYFGLRGNPDNETFSNIRRAKNGYDWFNNELVQSDGTLNDPVTAGLVTEPSDIEKAKSFVFGDWGETETLWRQSSEYKFALIETLLQFKPYFVFEWYWSFRSWRLNRTEARQRFNFETEIRQDSNEIHNQLITNGILQSIDVKSGGTGHSSSTEITFPETQFRYQNPKVDLNVDNNSIEWISVSNTGRNLINDNISYDISGSGSGQDIVFNISNSYYLTKLGWNSILAEFYNEKTDSNNLSDILKGIDLKYIVHVGGYTDKKIIDVGFDGFNDKGRFLLSDQDYEIKLDSNPSYKTVYYSGIKIEKVNNQFKVSGFDFDQKWFDYYQPLVSGSSTIIDINENVSIERYDNYSNTKGRTYYNTVFSKRQDLFNFIISVGEYYERNGFRIRSIWRDQAVDAIRWTLDDSTEPFYINGSTGSLFYEQGERGFVQPFNTNNRFFSVIGKNKKPVKSNDIVILRNDETSEIYLKTNVNNIFGIKICIVEYEHVVIINNVTSFGDKIYDQASGLIHDHVNLFGKRTRDWKGRLTSNGYLINDSGIIHNVETSIREVERDWINDSTNVLEPMTKQTAWYNVGYIKPSYMTNSYVNDISSYEFEKGRRKNKGNIDTLKAIARNKNIFGSEFNGNVYEEWMVRLGDYGDLRERESLQFEIFQKEITSDKQQFSFSKTHKPRIKNHIINYHENGLGFISGNFKKPFNTYEIINDDLISSIEDQQEFLPDIGLPLLNDVDFIIEDETRLNDIYNPVEPYALIQNWNNQASYIRGDNVRYKGSVYTLNRDSIGRNVISDIVIRGNRVSPIVRNGETLIFNDNTITFNKIEQQTVYSPITASGIPGNSILPSGNNLSIDGTRVDFIKTREAYSNIVITGTISNPTLSANETITIYHSSSSAEELEDIDIALQSGDDLDQIIDRIEEKLTEFRLSDVITVEKSSSNNLVLIRNNDLELPGPRLGISNSSSLGFSGSYLLESEIDPDNDENTIDTTGIHKNVQKIYNDIVVTGTEVNPVVSRLEISNVIIEENNPLKIVTSHKHNLKNTDTIQIEELNGSDSLNAELNGDHDDIIIENDTTIIINGTNYDSDHYYNTIGGSGFLSILDNNVKKRRLSIFYADDLTTTLTEVELLLEIDDDIDTIISTESDEKDISSITLTSDSPVSITSTGHRLSTGDEITISGVVGTTELNGNTYTIAVVDADTFTLDDTDGDDFTDYTSDGTFIKITLSSKNIEFSKMTNSNSDEYLVIKRTNPDYSSTIRFGVSDNNDFGFVAKTDILVSEKAIDDDLVLSEIVDIINNFDIENVTASVVDRTLTITKSLDTVNPQDTTLVLSSTDSDTISQYLGLVTRTYRPNSGISPQEVDLTIGDIVSEINEANIEDLIASQNNNQLVITFTGSNLVVGDGTANDSVGLISNTYVSQIEGQENEFDINDWIKTRDLVDISILIINDISSRTNKATIFHTIDLDIGISEICPGIETGDDAEIECNNPHILNLADYVMIIGSNSIPSVDGIYKVTNVVDGRKFRIDKFIEEKGLDEGKIIPIKRISFNNKNEAESILDSSEYFDLTQSSENRNGLRTGTKVYVDNYNDGVGATLILKLDERKNLTLDIDSYETPKVNNRNIKNAYLLDKNKNQVIIDYEIFDPAKGIIPKIVDREIDIKSDIDIALYNSTTDTNKNLILENYWGDSQTGKVWWDISNAIYVNYDQGSIDYKNRYWGQLLGSSTIDVYEWTKSTVTPDRYEELVGTLINGIEISGEPYSVLNQFGDKDYYWCEDTIVNVNSGQLETYYYFWVKNKTNVPVFNRRFSVFQISNIIRDPEIEQIRWVAATSDTSLLVTGLTQVTGNIDLTMKIDFHPKNVNDYHQEFIILAENDPKTVIPEWLHMSLRNSLVGHADIIKYSVFEEYTSKTFSKNDIVLNNDNYFISVVDENEEEPILNTDGSINPEWNLLEVVEKDVSGEYGDENIIGYVINKPVPDETLHPNVRYGIQTRPSQSWFISLDNARKSFFTKLNSQLLTVNLIDSSLDWIDVFDSKYWSYVDWNKNLDNPFDQRLVSNTVDTYEELLGIDEPSQGDIIFVIDNLDSDNVKRNAAYIYNDKWELIYKQRATIQINENVWNKKLRAPVQENIPAGWDLVGWDSHVWDDGLDIFIRTVIDALYKNIWVGNYSPYYTDLWFFMAKHVLREQDNVDWIFKSSYVKSKWSYPLDQQHKNYVSYKDEELDEYICNVKPFRTKVRDSSINPEKIESVGLNSNYSLQFRVQTGETNPKSFNLVRTVNETEILYQIDDSVKLTLSGTVGIEDMELPLTANVSGTGTGYVWVNGERIEVDYDNSTGSNLTILNRGVSDTIKVIHNENDSIEIENIVDIDNSESIDITTGNDGSI